MIKRYQKLKLNPLTGRKTKSDYFEVLKMVSGKRIHKRGFETKTDAMKFEITLEQGVEAYKKSTSTIGDIYNMYINESKLHGSKLIALQSIEAIWDKRLKDYFNDIKVEELTNQKINIWKNNLLTLKKKNGDKYRNETLRNYQSALSTILNYGYKNEYISKPFSIKYVKHKSEEKSYIDFYTPEEFNLFIKNADNIIYKTFFLVLYFCGLRKGEAMALKWGDIDFKNSQLQVNKTWDHRNHILTTPKTANSYRVVLFPERVKAALEDLKSYYENPSSDCFVFGCYKPIARNTIDFVNLKYSRLANLKKIRIHDFRHSHVSLLINNNFSPFDIAKRLGHTPEMVNNRYGHWFKESQNKILNFLNTI